jgi:hypothetical protein
MMTMRKRILNKHFAGCRLGAQSVLLKSAARRMRLTLSQD